ncbi:MAG: phosphoenolpyruvate--protein phosphotransferase [Lachnospiraceae bacterium]|nr:phosphoenolpyruvate--protein phosphotransferase [Lachnospiraceae bacterium]
MEFFSGKSICEGIVIGKIRYYSKRRNNIERVLIDDCAAESERFSKAKEIAKKRYIALRDKAAREISEAKAMIFEVYAMLLEDAGFNDSVVDIINSEKANAEYAVAVTGDRLVAKFSQMDDEYFRARSVDVKDICDSLVRILMNESTDIEELNEPVIIAAEDLTPAETVQLDKSKLLSLVTECGTLNSHTAILARTMNLPSLVGVSVDERWDGKFAIVDGIKGQLIVEPDEETLANYRALAEKDRLSKELLMQLKGKPCVTQSGKEIMLYANIGSVDDVDAALENDAAGIGLFRSEFLYLEKSDYPTEEEQYEAYKKVVQAMDGRKVIIRTFDIGADKQADYFNPEQEDNPAMGYRAIRICLDRTDVFKTQLRAIYRAAAHGNVAVMFPMVISLEEVLEIKKICEQVMDDLKNEGVEYGEAEIGIMIETPAAVMISDILADEVDFFSIGTNDLTQFTLAVDRYNSKLDKYYNPHHEAVLRMIRTVIDNGHAGGCWVGICGELGADTSLTDKLISMGIDEISVSPSNILQVKKAIREAEG